METLDQFGVRVAALQHVLEGYKVADAMVRYRAGGSAFSDWWAYKFEVYDAIPYNGALMHRAGVLVSFNSDSRELARHLNHEAAKAVKYGGLSPEEALNFVTRNPAEQLMVEQYVGSLAPGKQADLVVWSGPPLSNYSRPEQTWVDGRKYFDLDEHRLARRQARKRHAALVQKVLALEAGKKKSGEKEEETDH
jgi:N-acetylglucosamine-6-phosphate deacetylase